MKSIDSSPIAIVGMACAFPGAPTLGDFWEALESGRDLLDTNRTSRESGRHRMGLLPDVDLFDPGRFGMSAAEAQYTDPQQRLMLEAAAAALEDAGMPASRCNHSRVGVFVGISSHDYAILVWNDSSVPPPATAGTCHGMAANRISWWLGAGGPSMSVDTACSSALTAFHLARRSFEAGEIDLAIVGGVSALLLPHVTETFAAAKVVSPTGMCRPFDRQADGYVRSEGAAAVVLEPYDRAQQRRARMYAMVLGSSVNHNGISNGLTAPNPARQQAVIEAACQSAAVDSAEIQYVEAMGSGTLMGDTIELKSVAAALRANGAMEPLRVGSVKSNLGHTEAASGMASLVKTALALHHRKIPPTLHVERENGIITQMRLPLRLTTSLEDWPAEPGEATAGVSSWGFGGANAHVVLREAPAIRIPRSEASHARLLMLSARDAENLRALAAAWLDLLERGEQPLDDLCFTAALGRDFFQHRLAAFGDREAIIEALRGNLPANLATGSTRPANKPKIALWFGGSPMEPGLEWDAAIEVYPSLRKAWQACRVALGSDRRALDFALRYSIAAFWLESGLKPVCIGHDSESALPVAAAAGELSIEEAFQGEGDCAGVAMPGSGIDLTLDALDRDEFWPASHLARLFVAGASLRWVDLLAGWPGRLCDAPLTPLTRTPCWFPKTSQPRIADNPEIYLQIEQELKEAGY